MPQIEWNALWEWGKNLLGLLAACCALVFIAIVACTVVIGG